MLATLGGTLALLLGLAILMLPLLVSELSRPRDSVWGALVLLLGLVLVTSAERLSGEPMLAVLLGGLLIGRLGGEVAQARWLQLTLEERQRMASAERWRTSFDQLGAAIARLLAGAAAGVAVVGAWIAERRKPPAITKRWVRPESAPSNATDALEPSGATEATEPSEAADAAEQSTTPAEVRQEPDPTAGSTDPQPAATPDAPAPEAAEGSDPSEAAVDTDVAAPEQAPTESAQDHDEVVVSGFDEIDALLAATETSRTSPENPPAAKPGGPEAG